MRRRQLVVGGEELPGIAEELHQRIPAPRPLDHGGHLPAHGIESSLGSSLGVDEREEPLVRLFPCEPAGEEVAEEGFETAEVGVEARDVPLPDEPGRRVVVRGVGMDVRSSGGGVEVLPGLQRLP